MKTMFSLDMLVSCLALAGSARGQDYSIPWFTIDGGGVTATQSPGAPLLSITHSSGTAIVSWPRSAEGLTLEQTGALATPPYSILWSTVLAGNYQTNATHISIIVPLTSDNKFYRLRGP